MSERDLWTVRAMEETGGDMARSLARLARVANELTLEVLKVQYQLLWDEYEADGIDMQEHPLRYGTHKPPFVMANYHERC